VRLGRPFCIQKNIVARAASVNWTKNPLVGIRPDAGIQTEGDRLAVELDVGLATGCFVVPLENAGHKDSVANMTLHASPALRTNKNGAVRQELAPVKSKVLYYCFVAVKVTGVTVVPVIDFMSDETVTL
jgi:hypothetical protein